MTQQHLSFNPAEFDDREAFIAAHSTVCSAKPCPRYERGRSGYHSAEYARRKCAKNLWRKKRRLNLTAPDFTAPLQRDLAHG